MPIATKIEKGSGDSLLSKEWVILLLFAGLALVLRFFSFFPSVINHDESTYLIIADAIRRGKLYFVEVIDTKPIGIFLLIAVFQSVVGKSIFAFRVFAALWIACTAYGIFRIQQSLGGQRRAALAAGILYIFMLSIFTFYGLSPNTEIFFNAFTIAALWLMLNRRQWWQDILAGLLLGFGFMIKYVVLFDALAFGLFLLWMARGDWKALGLVVKRGLVMSCFFLLPFGLTYLFYYQQGHAGEFLFYTFDVTSRYPVEKTFSGSGLFLLDFFARFFPVTLMAVYCWFDRSVAIPKLKTLVLIWGLAVGTAILLPGKLFGHYFIQFMPLWALLAGAFFDSNRKRPAWIGRVPLSWRYGLLGLLILVLMIIQKKDNYDREDQVAIVANYLQPRLRQGDRVYTGNYQQILYYLLDRESPTPYVHRSLLWDPHHVAALQIDLQEQTRQILETHPRFVLLSQRAPDNLLLDSIYVHYRRIEDFGGGIELYERR